MTAARIIRIGTWNVEYAHNARNPDRMKMLMTHPADIWVLTETHNSLKLPEPYSSYPSHPRPIVRNVDTDSTWVTIWSRFELCKRIDVPDPLRQVAAVFNTPVGRVAVAGVVLPWHCDKGDKVVDPSPTNWSEHKRVLRDEIPILLERLSSEEDCHRVLAGDFNTDLAPPYTPYGYGPGQAGRNGWHTTLKLVGLVCHTMNEPYPDPPNRNLIDHICTDFGTPRSITTWAGEDGKKPRLSDHPGVVVSFQA